ncbi:uncharacterized protein FIBRA_08713 [Fibroporia radiculosa]|uniref:Stress response protein NST1 n=1 Tax=Fibroporia radiculosa TaxID=599839 RepID=J4H5B5_9APHY|nr:uncharacterized protein FIBRA_08713 [Fibroporia radiculosa]CCM06449.1 predicted protein [Fibroporia radiculosa]
MPIITHRLHPPTPPLPISLIWSTSTTEERERIKEFWLGLGEEERRNLVKIEKEAVLKKMKEQQKHSCSCAVCGRKRNAIEEELEVLYDAYYEELEQYANYQQRYISSGGTLPPPQGPGPFPGSVELDKNGAVINPHAPANAIHRTKGAVMTNGRKPAKQPESEFDEDDGDEEYEEEDDYEEEDEEEEEEEEEDDGEVEDEEDVKPHPDRRTPSARRRAPPNGAKANGRDGIGNFGNNLTVTGKWLLPLGLVSRCDLIFSGAGNILTVADDLLKNDGQKFLEMMEQLAERRMQREEEAAADVEDDSEDEDEDDGDEDEDDEDDDEDEEDEEEVMTEEQKMEEGKRMFSIFAARMFEQRVLQAYREKVAQARQLQLLRELEDEDKVNKEKEVKKQTQNQKKKDKKRQQKLAKEEERAAKAAEKAAEEAAIKAKQVALEDEQRKKREEERARREVARKAQEEERHRKEEERRKRLAEEKEREAERERKRKERDEKARAERREKEERDRKAREEREAKLAAERAAAAAAKREQQEREREEREKRLAKERLEREKAEKERAEKEKADREARERAVQQQQRASSSRNPRPPTSPRNANSAGPSQRSPNHAGPAKKILNKSTPAATPVIQPPRPQQPRPTVVTNAQPPPIASQIPNHLPPSTPLFSPVGGIIPPVLSPRIAHTPGPFIGMAPGLSMQPTPPPLAPSALPRAYGNGSPFDPAYGRPLAPPAPIAPPTPITPQAPIAPPSRAAQNTLSSPTQMLNSSPGGRASGPDPGPITRPIAPIARPTTEASGSGSTSPTRQPSPSPKEKLGSAALIADDDEIVPAPGRRIAPGVPVGQAWGSPRSSLPDMRTPWGPPGPSGPPSFASPRPPALAPSLWSTPTPDWQHSPSFYGGPFVTHNPSPPPHTGS